MKKIDLGLKHTTWVKEFSYGLLSGGAHDGVPGFKLVLSGQDETENNPADLLEGVIHGLNATKHSTRDIFRISGDISSSPLSTMLLRTLLYAIQPFGLNVQIVLKDSLIPNIPMQMFSWVVYETSKTFLPFPVNEVWFKPEEGMSLEDLSFTGVVVNPNQTLFFLSGRFDEESILKFFSAQSTRWAYMK